MFETWLGHWRIIRIYLHQSSLSTTWLWSSKSPNGWTWDIFWKESVWGATSVHPTTLEQRQLLPLWLICTYLKGNSQISIWYHDQATQPVTIWNNPKNTKKGKCFTITLHYFIRIGIILFSFFWGGSIRWRLLMYQPWIWGFAFASAQLDRNSTGCLDGEFELLLDFLWFYIIYNWLIRSAY